jgi:GAF domain-containing protein
MDEQTRLQGEVRALYAITSAISGSLNQQEVLSTMLANTCRELHYKAATVRLLDEERQTLSLKASYGLSEAYLAKGEVEVSHSGIDQAALNGERVAVADVQQDAGFQYGRAAAQEGLASALVVPLTLQDGIIGVLRVYTAEPHAFTQQEQDFLGAVANLGAQAIQRSRLYNAFGTMAHDLTSTLELKEVLATLLLESVEHLNVKAGSIRLLGPNRETLHLAAAYGLSNAYLEKGAGKVAQSPIDQQVLNVAQPVAIADLQQEASFQYPEAAQREGIRSVLVVPLRVRGTTIGVMRMYSRQARRFSAEAITFATTVADLGAVAIENAKLHEALKARLEALKEDTDGWYRFLTLS